MDGIYEMADGRKVVLYSEGSRIMYLTLPLRRTALPAAVKEDYLQELTIAEFSGLLFFAYKNLKKQVVLDSLGDTGEMILLAENGICGELSGLKLCKAGEHLALFYVSELVTGEQKKSGEYVLEAIFPYKNREKRRLASGLLNPEYDLYIKEGRPVLEYSNADGRLQRCEWNNGSFRCRDVKTEAELLGGLRTQIESQITEKMKKECELRLESAMKEYELKLDEARGRFADEYEKLKQDCELKILEKEKQYNNALEIMESGYQRQLEKAAMQYDELSKVARNLQEALRTLAQKSQA